MGIATGIDELLDLVQDKKKISIKDAARKLKVEEDKIETWSRVLSDEEMLELRYPANPLEPPFLQVVGYTEKKKRKKKKKKDVYKEKKKEKTKDKEKRRLPKRAFLKRFKGSRKKEFKTYKQKLKSKEKKRTPMRNQLILLAAVIVIIILLFIYFGGPSWLPGIF